MVFQNEGKKNTQKTNKTGNFWNISFSTALNCQHVKKVSSRIKASTLILTWIRQAEKMSLNLNIVALENVLSILFDEPINERLFTTN